MQIVFLILGSIMAVVTLILAMKGKKFTYLMENLDTKDYPLRGLYSIGFALSEKGALMLKGKMREKLIGQAKLLYDPKYAEYYASVTWAQTLSFVFIGLTIGVVLTGVIGSVIMLIIGIGAGVFFGFYFLNHMNDVLKSRETECTAELPEVVSTMTLLVNAGMMLRNAWRTIAESKEGIIYSLMLDACNDMENGMSEVDAIHKFGKYSNSAEVRKFASALCQSLERGGGELADFLGKQSGEMWTLKKQIMLQKGEAAATKLLFPTVMLFGGIICAVFSGAIGMLL